MGAYNSVISKSRFPNPEIFPSATDSMLYLESKGFIFEPSEPDEHSNISECLNMKIPDGWCIFIPEDGKYYYLNPDRGLEVAIIVRKITKKESNENDDESNANDDESNANDDESNAELEAKSMTRSEQIRYISEMMLEYNNLENHMDFLITSDWNHPKIPEKKLDGLYCTFISGLVGYVNFEYFTTPIPDFYYADHENVLKLDGYHYLIQLASILTYIMHSNILTEKDLGNINRLRTKINNTNMADYVEFNKYIKFLSDTK